MKPGELVQIRGKSYSVTTLDMRLVVLIETDVLMYLRDFSCNFFGGGMGLYLFGDRLVMVEKNSLKRLKT